MDNNGQQWTTMNNIGKQWITMDNNPRCACISEAVSCSPIGNSCQIIGRHIKFSILYLHCGVWVFYAPTTQNTARPEAIFMHQCGQPHIRTNLTISCMEYDIDQVKPQSIMNSWWADLTPCYLFWPHTPNCHELHQIKDLHQGVSVSVAIFCEYSIPWQDIYNI